MLTKTISRQAKRDKATFEGMSIFRPFATTKDEKN